MWTSLVIVIQRLENRDRAYPAQTHLLVHKVALRVRSRLESTNLTVILKTEKLKLPQGARSLEC
jgi:hypothetical protein